MIPDSDLEVLQSFNGHGNVMLSVYLRLDTPERRDAAYDVLVQQAQVRLEERGPQPGGGDAIKEDMDIVGLYLKTNGYRHHPGLAIFSCAAELFWRAYPLPVPVPTQVTVGPRFDLEPLMQFIGRRTWQGA